MLYLFEMVLYISGLCSTFLLLIYFWLFLTRIKSKTQYIGGGGVTLHLRGSYLFKFYTGGEGSV